VREIGAGHEGSLEAAPGEMLEEVVEEVLKRRQLTAASAMYGAFSSVRISVREEEIVE
jgi:hypothetical protein